MSEKKKFTLEYAIRSSPRILYSFISEPNGLAQWFADDVIFRDQVYTFVWDDEEQKAKLISIKENKLIKFALERWKLPKEKLNRFIKIDVFEANQLGKQHNYFLKEK